MVNAPDPRLPGQTGCRDAALGNCTLGRLSIKGSAA
jgi:hypothetical protein